MAKALTAKTLENLKVTSARQEVPDGLIRGFFFVLQPTGKGQLGCSISSPEANAETHVGDLPGD